MSDAPHIPRDEAERLLVFLANDRLEGAERAAVEAVVAEDPALARELVALRNIRTAMQAEEPLRSPGEFGLARLMRDIGAEQRPAQQPPARRIRIWQYAAAAAVALFALQTALVWTVPDAVVELAGGGAATDTGPTLTVAFRPAAAEADIRTLLLDAGLVIVDGPSALGLYVLAAPDAAARDTALAALRARSDIIESAERGD